MGGLGLGAVRDVGGFAVFAGFKFAWFARFASGPRASRKWTSSLEEVDTCTHGQPLKWLSRAPHVLRRLRTEPVHRTPNERAPSVRSGMVHVGILSTCIVDQVKSRQRFLVERAVCGRARVPWIPPPSPTDHHSETEHWNSRSGLSLVSNGTVAAHCSVL